MLEPVVDANANDMLVYVILTVWFRLSPANYTGSFANITNRTPSMPRLLQEMISERLGVQRARASRVTCCILRACSVALDSSFIAF
jgi:hypothetical protein